MYRGSGGHGSSQDGIGLNADARWAFLPDWYASVILSHNGARFDAGTNFQDLNLETDATGNTIWLTIG